MNAQPHPSANYIYGALATTTSDLRAAADKAHNEALNLRDSVRLGKHAPSYAFLAKYAAEAAELEKQRAAYIQAALAVGLTEDDIQAAIKEGLGRG